MYFFISLFTFSASMSFFVYSLLFYFSFFFLFFLFLWFLCLSLSLSFLFFLSLCFSTYVCINLFLLMCMSISIYMSVCELNIFFSQIYCAWYEITGSRLRTQWRSKKLIYSHTKSHLRVARQLRSVWLEIYYYIVIGCIL